MGDPRLRLLGNQEENSTSQEILKTLDDTRILIKTGSDMSGSHTSALAAFMVIACRLFGEISMVPPVDLTPNWWGASTSTQLLEKLTLLKPRVISPPSRDITVSWGNEFSRCDWGIGGDDFTVLVGREPQPLGKTPQHSLGVHAAACIGISQIMNEILEPFGFKGVILNGNFVMNLVDYRLAPAPDFSPSDFPSVDTNPLQVVVAGVGSVGSSALALIAMALGSTKVENDDGRRMHKVETIAIDDDSFDPQRNPFRYPVLLGTEQGNKALIISEQLKTFGISSLGVPTNVSEWARSTDKPGVNGLLLSSVDTLDGRLNVTDVLAKSTLSIGVSGLAMHAQREKFADGYACPFCDYVDLAPTTTQATAFSQLTGLPVPRILSLIGDNARLEEKDIDMAIAALKITPERREQLIGARFYDLIKQAYAEITLPVGGNADTSPDLIAVAAPQVSWFSGVVAAVEIVKQISGMPLLDRRVDADLKGLPAGVVRQVKADASGRCLCRSGVRIDWYREMYAENIS